MTTGCLECLTCLALNGVYPLLKSSSKKPHRDGENTNAKDAQDTGDDLQAGG